jgi:hypothetical protein
MSGSVVEDFVTLQRSFVKSQAPVAAGSGEANAWNPFNVLAWIGW